MKISQVAAEYYELFNSAIISPRRIGEVDGIITQIMMHQNRYEAVESYTKVPWYVVALIHNLECSLSFRLHLHNGDSLKRKTRNDPAGRPPGWDGTGTWEESALDALRYDRLDQYRDWDIARICFMFETFNGWGYRNRGIHSPYLWAGCQHYTKGKYVADHKYSASAVSQQLGSAVLLKRLTERHLVALRASPV
jgi:lysozyme family protein